jgi:hypothetical protein
MNKENLILKLIDILVGGDFKPESSGSCVELVGKPVIVRCRDAGVHFGYYKCHSGREVQLTKSRRMWRWWAAKQMTLSAVAEFGLNKEKPIRIQNELDFIILGDACEIIPCTQACVDSFTGVEPYDEQ